MPVTLKPGWKTTELWVAVLTDVGIVVAALAGNLSPHYAAIATAVSSSAYAIARGLAKLNPPKAVEPVAAPAAPAAAPAP